MMESEAPGVPGLWARVRGIIMAPRTEWPVIAAERASIGSIYRSYVAPLAAIPAVAGFIAAAFIGFDMQGEGPVRLGMGEALAASLLQYGFALVMVGLLALLIDALAAPFGGVADRLSAFKLAAYSLTPAWLSGLAVLLPGFGWLGILGFYGVWLFYLGTPVLMQVPRDRAAIMTGAVVTGAIVLSFLVALILSVLMPMPMPGPEG